MYHIDTPDMRGGEDERFCCAKLLLREERLKQTSEDYILPDYLPDVKKVVGVFPQALIKNRFLGSGTLSFEGEARYKILYVSDAGELKSVVFFSGFDDKIGGEELSEECVDLIEPKCVSVSVRMVNPRKFNLRAQTGAQISVYRRGCYLPEYYGARTADDGQALVTRQNTFESVNVTDLRENGLSLSEDLSFDAAAPTADELIFYTAVPSLTDCRTSEGEAQCRGTVAICALMTSVPDAAGVGSLIVTERTVPFSVSLRSNALHDGGWAVGRVTGENCALSLREDEFGQKRTLEFDMNYGVDLTVFTPKDVSVVDDAYSVKNETESESSWSDFVSLASPLRGSFSVNESVELDLPDGGAALENVFYAPELNVICEDGRALLVGSCGIAALIRGGGGSRDMRRASVPLRLKTEASCEEGELFGTVCPRVEGARARLDKNKLTLDFEVCYYGCVLKKKRERAMTSLRVLPGARTAPGKRGSVILCYPDKGEDAFSISKRYAVRPEAIEKQLSERKQPLVIRK